MYCIVDHDKHTVTGCFPDFKSANQNNPKDLEMVEVSTIGIIEIMYPAYTIEQQNCITQQAQKEQAYE